MMMNPTERRDAVTTLLRITVLMSVPQIKPTASR